MDIVAKLSMDVSALGQKLSKFYQFYYDLKKACYIPINVHPNYTMPESYKEYRISEDEYKCWQKVKKLIDGFDVP